MKNYGTTAEPVQCTVYSAEPVLFTVYSAEPVLYTVCTLQYTRTSTDLVNCTFVPCTLDHQVPSVKNICQKVLVDLSEASCGLVKSFLINYMYVYFLNAD